VASGVFLAKQYQRQLLNANTLQALETRVQERAHDREKRCATPAEFFQGLWDFHLSLFTLIFYVDLDQRHYFHRIRKVSVFRETVYQLIAVLIFFIPFGIAGIVRGLTTPRYMIANGCTGCVVDLTDVVIVCVLIASLSLPLLSLRYKVETFNIPDPLMSLLDMQRGYVATTKEAFYR
jgi:hypothetical protein